MLDLSFKYLSLIQNETIQVSEGKLSPCSASEKLKRLFSPSHDRDEIQKVAAYLLENLKNAQQKDLHLLLANAFVQRYQQTSTGDKISQVFDRLVAPYRPQMNFFHEANEGILQEANEGILEDILIECESDDQDTSDCGYYPEIGIFADPSRLISQVEFTSTIFQGIDEEASQYAADYEYLNPLAPHSLTQNYSVSVRKAAHLETSEKVSLMDLVLEAIPLWIAKANACLITWVSKAQSLAQHSIDKLPLEVKTSLEKTASQIAIIARKVLKATIIYLLNPSKLVDDVAVISDRIFFHLFNQNCSTFVRTALKFAHLKVPEEVSLKDLALKAASVWIAEANVLFLAITFKAQNLAQHSIERLPVEIRNPLEKTAFKIAIFAQQMLEAAKTFMATPLELLEDSLVFTRIYLRGALKKIDADLKALKQ